MSDIIIESGEPHFIFIIYDISDPSFRAKVREYLKMNLFVAKNFSVYYGPWDAVVYAEVSKWATQELERIRRDPERRHQIVDIRVIPTAVSQADFITLLDEYEQKFKEQWASLERLLDETDEMIVGNIKNPVKDDKGNKTGEEVEFTAKQILQRVKHSEHLVQLLEEALAKKKEHEQKKWQDEPARQRQHEELFKQLRGFVLKMDSQKKSVESRIAREKAKEAADKGQQALPPTP